MLTSRAISPWRLLVPLRRFFGGVHEGWDPCTRRKNVIANHSNHNTFGRAEFDMPQFLNDHFTCMQAA